jgi:hypothetical protein
MPETKEQRLLRKYGMHIDHYQYMIDKQQNLCAICKKEMKPPHIDHDHATGKIRSLLCLNCNTGLGMLKDDIKLLAGAIVYLATDGSVPPIR